MQDKYKGIARWIGGYGKVTGQWSKLCPSDENYDVGMVGRRWSWSRGAATAEPGEQQFHIITAQLLPCLMPSFSQPGF